MLQCMVTSKAAIRAVCIVDFRDWQTISTRAVEALIIPFKKSDGIVIVMN